MYNPTQIRGMVRTISWFLLLLAVLCSTAVARRTSLGVKKEVTVKETRPLSDGPRYDRIGMFDERGFYKSESYQLSSQGAIVSNFNGNLMYKKVLFKEKGPGDLDLEIALVYNGSVAHSIRWYLFQSDYSVNFPEWILSVNGVAVKVFNYEDYILNNYHKIVTTRHFLVEGYHKTNQFNPLGGDSKDMSTKIGIIMGDGSCSEFYDTGNIYSWSDIGIYYPLQKENYQKAYITAWDSLNSPLFRTFTLKRPDGVDITYQEIVMRYEDLNYPYHPIEPYPVGNRFRFYDPHALYPVKISDRYGNEIRFFYTTTEPNNPTIYGFPELDSIMTPNGTYRVYITQPAPTGNPHQFYSEYPILAITSPDNGVCTAYPRQTDGRNPMIQKIVDQAGRADSFTYEQYNRYYIFNTGYYSDKDTLKITKHRVRRIDYSSGGHSTYEYYEPSPPDTSDFTFTCWYRHSNLYQTLGREPLWINMVRNRITYLDDSDTLCAKRENYDFSTGGTPPCQNSQDIVYYTLVDKADTSCIIYVPLKDKFKMDPSDGLNIKTRYSYKMYPYFDHDNDDPDASSDCGWDIKLQAEKVDEVKELQTYEYDVTCPDNCYGTFKLKNQKTGYNNSSDSNYVMSFDANDKYYEYRYDYLTAVDLLNIIEVKEIDPFSTTKRTKYKSDYLNVVTDTTLYLNNLVSDEAIFADSTLTDTLARTEYTYYTSSGDSSYIASLKEKKQRLFEGDTDIITRYYYYNNSTEGFGNMMKIVEPNGNETRFWYSTVIDPVSGQNFSSNKRFFTKKTSYNPQGVDLSIYRSYTSPGLVSKEADENGSITKYNYDPLNRIKGIIYPLESDTSVRYIYTDTPGIMSTLIKEKMDSTTHKQTKYCFDGFDRLYKTMRISSEGNESTMVGYHEYSGWKSYDINENGYGTGYNYNELGQVKRINYPGGSYISYDYTAFSNLPTYKYSRLRPGEYIFTKTVIDENGHKTVYQEDALGNVVAVLQYTGSSPNYNLYSTTYYDYDLKNYLIYVQDGEGHVTSYSYDALNRLQQKNSVDDGTIQYVYDDVGNITFKRDANREADQTYGWVYSNYDAQNRFKEEGLLQCTNCDYDTSWSNLCNVSANDSNDTCYFSVKYGQIVKWSVTFGLSLKIANSNSMTYNCFRVVDSLTAEEIVETCDVDSNGQFYAPARSSYKVIAISGSQLVLGHTHYNPTIDRICTPDDSVYTKVWKTKFEYDTNYVTPPTGLDNPKGSLTKAQTSDGNIEKYLYDKRNRLGLKKVTVSGLSEKEIKYTYNKLDQVDTLSYPDANKVLYRYNDLGRLYQIGDASDSDRYATYTYTPTGKVQQCILGNNVQMVNYTYNNRDWLTQINQSSVVGTDTGTGDHFALSLSYYTGGYGDVGYKNGNIAKMITKISKSGGMDTLQYKFSYDELDRIKVASCSDTTYTERYSYDKNGNLDSLKRGTTWHDYVYYPNNNRLKQVTGWTGQKVFNYLYDPNGNMTADSSKVIYLTNYNHRNLPTHVNMPNRNPQNRTFQLDFYYDPSGNRVKKSYLYYYWDDCGQEPPPGQEKITPDSPESTLKRQSTSASSTSSGGPPPCVYSNTICTYYVYSEDNILAEYDGSGALTNKYIYAGNERIAVRQTIGNKLLFYLKDHLGCSRVIVDTTGKITAKYNYYPFGDNLNSSVSQGSEYKYTGKELDEEGGFGLYYYGARYYDARIGRFTSIDPPLKGDLPDQVKLEPIRLNPYAYAGNNPLKNVDVGGEYLETAIDVAFTALDIKQFIEMPSWSQAGWVALDVVSLALPVFSAAMVRGGRTLIEGERVVKAVSEGDKVSDLAKGGTYMLKDAERSGEVAKVGRSNDLGRRRSELARNPETKGLDFKVDKRTDSYAQQRGREQIIRDKYKPRLNKINPIYPKNPKREEFLKAARKLEE